ncbi:MAG: hypothetical protein JRJ08_06405, partial [Deltaproteobacteria bacterium]|nr:hypothetical protein [Deltaproteobacteria bacterium]
MNNNTFKIFIFCIFFSVFLNHYKAYPQGWSDLTVSSLPDSSFALLEVDENRNKVRHLPYRDMNGNIDIEQLIYCLGSFSDESWVKPENQDLARKTLDERYYR